MLLDRLRIVVGLCLIRMREMQHRRQLRRAGLFFHTTVFEGQRFGWYAESRADSLSSRTVSGGVLPSVRISHYDRPILICLHGFLDRGFAFRRIVPLLQESFRLIILDLPGHGASLMPAVRELWTAGGITRSTSRFLNHLCARERPLILAHSMGGLIALRMALLRGRGFLNPSAICCLAPGAMLPVPEKLESLRRYFFPESVDEVRSLLVRISHRSAAEVTDFVCRALLHRWSAPGLHYLSQNTMEFPAEVFLEKRALGQIPVPVLLIWGRNDRIIDPAEATALLRGLRDGELQWVDEAGHSLLVESPARVADLLLGWFRRRFRPGSGSSSHNRPRLR